MTRRQLEHVIVEIGERFGLDYFYVVGASAVLAVAASPDEDLVLTRDVDVIPNLQQPKSVQEMADRIDFVLGEGSDFEREFGYYAQGVDFSTPTYAPTGWRARCVPLRTRGITALCMEVHDLVISKLGAGRPKDLEFARALARHRHIDEETLHSRVDGFDVSVASRIERKIDGLFNEFGGETET